MSHPPLPHDLLPLIESLINGTIRDDEFAHLDRILAESPEARALYRRYINLHAALPALLGDSPRLMFRGAEQQSGELVDWDTDSRAGFLRLLHKLDAEDGQATIVDLAELRHLEAQTTPPRQDPADPIAIRELPIVVGYLLHKTLTSRTAAVVGLAAAFLLATALIGLYWTGPQDTTQEAGQADATPDLNAPTVATLTALRGDYRAALQHSVGDTLRPGQRLTLTHGIAEVTTARGACAIIQAPCTIELLDNDNALRLIHGKLVGICETDTAKGLLVRTAHMDIIDVGTRFGVDASDPAATQVHVLQGEVTAARTTSTGIASTPQTLTQNQAAIAYANGNGLQRIAAEPERFAAILPHIIDLPGTGHGLSIGEPDPNWQVVAVNGRALETPVLMEVGNALRIGEGRAQRVSDKVFWLSDNTRYPSRTDPETALTCRTTIEVPAGVDPKQAELALTFGADDRIVQIRINGKAFTPPENQWTGTNAASTAMRIEGALLAGTNTIEFDIIDVARLGNTLWGLGVQWHLEVGTSTTP